MRWWVSARARQGEDRGVEEERQTSLAAGVSMGAERGVTVTASPAFLAGLESPVPGGHYASRRWSGAVLRPRATVLAMTLPRPQLRPLRETCQSPAFPPLPFPRLPSLASKYTQSSHTGRRRHLCVPARPRRGGRVLAIAHAERADDERDYSRARELAPGEWNGDAQSRPSHLPSDHSLSHARY